MAHVADSWRRHIQSLGRWLRCLLKAHDSLLLGISKPNDRLRIVEHIRFLVCAWYGGRESERRSTPWSASLDGAIAWMVARQGPESRDKYLVLSLEKEARCSGT